MKDHWYLMTYQRNGKTPVTMVEYGHPFKHMKYKFDNEGAVMAIIFYKEITKEEFDYFNENYDV